MSRLVASVLVAALCVQLPALAACEAFCLFSTDGRSAHAADGPAGAPACHEGLADPYADGMRGAAPRCEHGAPEQILRSARTVLQQTSHTLAVVAPLGDTVFAAGEHRATLNASPPKTPQFPLAVPLRL